jgi:hypothetical protein
MLTPTPDSFKQIDPTLRSSGTAMRLVMASVLGGSLGWSGSGSMRLLEAKLGWKH